MRIAVEGCAHGELDRIYASIKHLERVENITVDLLLICGDFQVSVSRLFSNPAHKAKSRQKKEWAANGFWAKMAEGLFGGLALVL